MDDAELVRKLKRVPSVDLALIRAAIAFLEFDREDPAIPTSEELAALDNVVVLTVQLAGALERLGWRGKQHFDEQFLGGLGWGGAFGQVAAIGAAACGARMEVGLKSRAGRPVSTLTRVVWMLAETIERGGGKADARQGGELCQAFGVVVEAAGLSVANQRETIRAALKARVAKQ